jgi:hemerythrin
MSSTHDDQSAGQVKDEILREHRELMTIIKELGDRAARGADTGEHWSAEMAEILTRLRTVLHQHFVGEEEGAFATEFPVAFPHLAGRLEDILSEHRELMERVDHLLRDVNEASEQATAEEVRRIRADVRGFIEAIRTHESAENSLLQEAYLEDVGGRG